jgi:class 3 adenylate cyclase/CHASE2 domain-containing sensor protein
VKFQPLRQLPALIACGVVVGVCLLAVLRLDFFERLERMTYDWRARTAVNFPAPVATNLGCVFITDDCIRAIGAGLLERRYGLYWPRHVYGRALRELAAQEARLVGFDVMFTDPRPDHAPLRLAPESDLESFLQTLHPAAEIHRYEQNGAASILMESDDFFAWQLKRSSRAALAAERGVRPNPLFATNAWALGDISADLDPDGVLRRALAFRSYTNWHLLFQMAEADPDYGVDLNRAVVSRGKIILPRSDLPEIEIPLDPNGHFRVADFIGEAVPPGMAPTAAPFTTQRVWHMGIVLAARELQLDLARAEVNLSAGRIVLPGPNGLTRVLPVDASGYFYINWELTPRDARLTTGSFSQLLQADQLRTRGAGAASETEWRDKLVVLGSAATGNDLTDHGATPLQKDTLLVSKHWNVANAVIMGRFIQPVTLLQQIALIVVLGLATAGLTWRLRAGPGFLSVLALALGYSVICVAGYILHRLWLPMVLPLVGALVVQYVLLVTYRVVFEQREQRRVKGIFSKVVSPNVARELLGRERLGLGGTRSEVTVLFADVRGFTELTDTSQEQVSALIREKKLDATAAEAAINESARETLNTVNTYLAIVADEVKRHDGTLDKYIGDCVMAFWGAPTPQVHHAAACVRAAIQAQRVIHDLNQARQKENEGRDLENQARRSAGLSPKPPLPVMALGTGINTGAVTVGLMGSNDHILNYTVFGREVNLASRLEAVSGRGRIIIGEATYAALQREAPELAAICREQEPTTPKGFQKPVRNFEVPWQSPAPLSRSSRSGGAR